MSLPKKIRRGHAAGGRISGPANVDPESVPAFLSPPEAWMTQSQFDALGQAEIDAIISTGTIVRILDEDDAN